MHFKLTILLLFCSISMMAQVQYNDLFARWPVATLQKCNTGKLCKYLTENEKQVLLLANLARANGKLFATTFLKRFHDSTGKAFGDYSVSLEVQLKKLTPLPPFQPHDSLFHIARTFADRCGKQGLSGHLDFDQRYDPALNYFNEVAENLFYGPDNPLIIVLELLIDEGVEDLGHRQNLLSESLQFTGFSIRPHTGYVNITVMSFGGK
jgi:uncharacterized protein YkwD